MGNIPRLNKDYNDISIEMICKDLDCGLLPEHLSPTYTRPVYAYTKAAVGGVSDELSNLRRAHNLRNVRKEIHLPEVKRKVLRGNVRGSQAPKSDTV